MEVVNNETCQKCRFYFLDGGIIEWCRKNAKGPNGKCGTSWAARKDATLCGPDARWFERRRWWQWR